MVRAHADITSQQLKWMMRLPLTWSMRNEWFWQDAQSVWRLCGSRPFKKSFTPQLNTRAAWGAHGMLSYRLVLAHDDRQLDRLEWKVDIHGLRWMSHMGPSRVMPIAHSSRIYQKYKCLRPYFTERKVITDCAIRRARENDKGYHPYS
jgi:hypothetical protein